jgi:hypothetical protein
MTPTPPATSTSTAIPQGLVQEIEDFRSLCNSRYHFNSRMDIALNIVGIAASLLVVAAGVYEWSKPAAILGGLITAIISAQRAFPFGQRWQFYRLLDSQAENLYMEAKAGVVTVPQIIDTMKAMRLDFAQQIPRGSSFRSDSEANDGAGAASGSNHASADGATGGATGASR